MSGIWEESIENWIDKNGKLWNGDGPGEFCTSFHVGDGGGDDVDDVNNSWRTCVSGLGDHGSRFVTDRQTVVAWATEQISYFVSPLILEGHCWFCSLVWFFVFTLFSAASFSYALIPIFPFQFELDLILNALEMLAKQLRCDWLPLFAGFVVHLTK